MQRKPPGGELAFSFQSKFHSRFPSATRRATGFPYRALHWRFLERMERGRFRDDVRSFMKADNDTATCIPYRLFGSPDIYDRA
jgi:hypothetical protein